MKTRVLLLDDDEVLLEIMQDLITTLGDFSVYRARSLKGLMELAPQAFDCDYAILDVNLGNGQPSGVEAYQWLLRNRFRGKIFFLTGHGQTHPQVAEAHRLGRARILNKPISADALTAILKGREAA